MDDRRNSVFVYGTLKKGEPNHDLLVDPDNGLSTFLGKAVTVDKWPLLIASRYNIPFLLHSKGDGHNVQGEIYSMDNKMLQKLDELENHPNYYQRLREWVLLQDSNQELEVWIYFLRNYKAALLELPQLESYSSLGSHGLRYVERYMRQPRHDYITDVRDIV